MSKNLNVNVSKYYRPEMSDEVRAWVDKNLRNYLEKNHENQTEVEHIVDYFMNTNPKRLQKMSYKEAATNAEKWTKALIKKGGDICETENDVETVMRFKSGMRVVKLKGEAAFKREGHLMSHCVASYYGNENCYIYSLRDTNNKPHCTIEVHKENGYINQIKGKGNGSIHPKYIKYILKILKKLGQDVNTHELENLGYMELNPTIWAALTKKYDGVQEITFKNTRYFYVHSPLKER